VDFNDLVAEFTETSIARQAWLAQRIGDHNWSFSEDSGELAFTTADGTKLTFSAQLLAFEESDGLYRWSWANDDVAPEIKETAEQLRDLGREYRLPVLTTPEFYPKAFDTTGNAIATVASGLCEAAFYYRAPPRRWSALPPRAIRGHQPGS